MVNGKKRSEAGVKNKGQSMMHLDQARSGGLLPAACILVVTAMAACATVKVQAPDKPIEINLNVKIEQEVRVRLDREIEDLIVDNPDVF